MGMFQLMHSHFIFLDSVKAILVHCAHRLLSQSTLILRTLKLPPWRADARRSTLLRSLLSVPSFRFFSFESRSLSVDGCRRTCAAVPESPWRNRLWVYGPRAKPASNCKTYMTHTVEGVRLLGFVLMVIGSWFHEVWLLPTGIVIIVLGWLRGFIRT